MTKTWGLIFGVVFLLIGVLGFVPGITSDGMLLGIFEVDTTHSIVHILTGIIALAVMNSEKSASIFFKVFGTVYGLVAIWGLVGSGSIFGLFHANLADNILHLVIAIVMLYVGLKHCHTRNKGEGMTSQAPAAPVMDVEPVAESTDMGSNEGGNKQV